MQYTEEWSWPGMFHDLVDKHVDAWTYKAMSSHSVPDVVIEFQVNWGILHVENKGSGGGQLEVVPNGYRWRMTNFEPMDRANLELRILTEPGSLT